MPDLSFLQNINPWVLAAITFAVIGSVTFYTKVIDKDYRDAGKIAVAAIVGSLIAQFAVHVGWFNGFLIGLNASGLITSLSAMGKNQPEHSGAFKSTITRFIVY